MGFDAHSSWQLVNLLLGLASLVMTLVLTVLVLVRARSRGKVIAVLGLLLTLVPWGATIVVDLVHLHDALGVLGVFAIGQVLGLVGFLMTVIGLLMGQREQQGAPGHPGNAQQPYPQQQYPQQPYR